MSLVLDCVCEGADVSICELTKLTWEVSTSILSVGGIGAIVNLQLLTSDISVSKQILDDPGGDYTFDLPIGDWVPLWDSIYLRMSGDASLLQIPPIWGLSFQQYLTNSDILLDYACINAVTGEETTHKVHATPAAAPLNECVDGDGTTRSVCFGGGGSLTQMFFKSTPLGLCNGCHLDATGFNPKPEPTTLKASASGDMCLCAFGGTEPYIYAIVEGTLPCGKHLDPTTGCIEGNPDLTCQGSASVTFRVTDATGAHAEVTCGFVFDDCAPLGNSFY